MEFGVPVALVLAVLALPVGYAALARRQPAVPVPSLVGLRGVAPTLRQRAAHWLPLLQALAVVLLAVALARPRVGKAEAGVEAEGIDIALVLDASTSMGTSPLGDGTRLDAAKEVIADFIQGRPDDRIGIVVFQQYSLALAPLTLDHVALAEAVKGVVSGLIPDGTGIGVGIAEALNLLRESAAAGRVVILLTDGNHNTDSISPEEAAGLAAAMNIRIYTVGLKADNPDLLLANEVDEDRLEAIARETGGRYFPASSESDLAGIYDDIGELETSKLDRQEFVAYREFGPWLALAAGLLVLLEIGAGMTCLRRIPQ